MNTNKSCETCLEYHNKLKACYKGVSVCGELPKGFYCKYYTKRCSNAMKILTDMYHAPKGER